MQQPQQPPPNPATSGYYPANPAAWPSPEPSINLGDLLRLFIQQKRFIGCVVALFTLAGLLGGWLLPERYSITAILAKPSGEDIAPINQTGVLPTNTGEAFGLVFQNLVSRQLQREFFFANDFPQKLTQRNDLTELERSQLFIQFIDNLSIKKERPDYLELEDEEKTPLQRLIISMNSTKPDIASDYINGYLQYVQHLAIDNIKAEHITHRNTQRKIIEKQLVALTAQVRESRMAKIQQILEADTIKRAEIEEQIKAEVQKARAARHANLAQIEEALQIATALNLDEPASLEDFSLVRRQSAASSQIAINTELREEQNRPLYLMGTKFLRTQKQLLEARSDDGLFSPAIPELTKQLELLKNNANVTVLEKRASDLAFIPELPELRTELIRLEQATLEFSSVKLARIELPAIPPSNPNSPNRPLIIMLSALIGCFVALFGAGIRIALQPSSVSGSTT